MGEVAQVGSCISCTAGQYAAVASAACTDCEAGAVDDDGDPSSECTACADGTYLGGSTVTNLDSITGAVVTLAAVDVSIVPGQRFRITPLDADADCTAATADGGTEIQVQSVDATTITLTVDLTGEATNCMFSAIECTACALGTADLDSDPSSPCAECTLGQYAAGGGTECTNCPAGQYDHDTGADEAIAVVSIDADANQVVVVHSAVWYYGTGDKLQLAHADGQTCAAAPLPPTGDLVIESAVHSCESSDETTECSMSEQDKYSDGPVAGSCTVTAGTGTCTYQTTLTFATDLTAGDGDAGVNCELVLPTQERSPCVECEVGKYSRNPGTVYRCFSCSAGTQAADATGSFVLYGAAQCVDCEAGKYDDDSNGGTLCVDCEAGTASAEGQATCTTCVAGQYAGTAAVACDDCVAGRYDDDSDASTECLDCIAGTYSVAGETICADCSTGKFADAAASFCAVCEVDTYDHDDDPGTECDSCPVGTNSEGETGLSSTPGCTENVCAPFTSAFELHDLGYLASASSVATQPQEFGILACYDATHSLSDVTVVPAATCEVAGATMVLTGCELRCTPYESEEAITALGYTVETPTAVTAGALGEIGCHAATHVLTDDLVAPSATCAGLPGLIGFSGCSARAECSTMGDAGHECPDSYHLNDDTLTVLCASHTCDSSIDRDTCCSPNTCAAQEPAVGYTVGSTAGETILDLEPVGCAAGYMGTPSDDTFAATTPQAPEVSCLKDTNSNAGDGAFAFTGCERSQCNVVDEEALGQRGYAVGNQDSLVRKTPFLRHFYTKNGHFTKTGSGQHIGKLQNEVFFRAGRLCDC